MEYPDGQHMLVIGTTRSGKTFDIKNDIIPAYVGVYGKRVFVIDPKGAWCKKKKGATKHDLPNHKEWTVLVGVDKARAFLKENWDKDFLAVYYPIDENGEESDLIFDTYEISQAIYKMQKRMYEREGGKYFRPITFCVDEASQCYPTSISEKYRKGLGKVLRMGAEFGINGIAITQGYKDLHHDISKNISRMRIFRVVFDTDKKNLSDLENVDCFALAKAPMYSYIDYDSVVGGVLVTPQDKANQNG